MPVCWNWQTRWTQNPLPAMACGFDPRHRHHFSKVRKPVILSGFADFFMPSAGPLANRVLS